jgi:hypothetical protein
MLSSLLSKHLSKGKNIFVSFCMAAERNFPLSGESMNYSGLTNSAQEMI